MYIVCGIVGGKVRFSYFPKPAHAILFIYVSQHSLYTASAAVLFHYYYLSNPKARMPETIGRASARIKSKSPHLLYSARFPRNPTDFRITSSSSPHSHSNPFEDQTFNRRVCFAKQTLSSIPHHIVFILIALRVRCYCCFFTTIYRCCICFVFLLCGFQRINNKNPHI